MNIKMVLNFLAPTEIGNSQNCISTAALTSRRLDYKFYEF
jgi:hypothetical protein